MAFSPATKARLAYALIGAACAYAVGAFLKYDFSGADSMSFYESESGLKKVAEFVGGTTLLSMGAFMLYFDMSKSQNRIGGI